MTLNDCIGCRDDFYNGKNQHGIQQCWHFDEQKETKLRYWISIHAPMGVRSNYVPVIRPPCYNEAGAVILERIPDYAEEVKP